MFISNPGYNIFVAALIQIFLSFLIVSCLKYNIILDYYAIIQVTILKIIL